jgi:outer membrane receptor for ferric coprogen and ferric-rhodotorulic acid
MPTKGVNMATGRRIKKGGNGNNGKEATPVNISLSVSDATQLYYCNYLAAAQTRYDFVLTLARVPAIPTDTQQESIRKNKVLPVEAAIQIAISPRLLPQMIKVLTEQKMKYEKRFGIIEREGDDGVKKPDRIR